jgi:hypothetical protein
MEAVLPAPFEPPQPATSAAIAAATGAAAILRRRGFRISCGRPQ